MTSILVQYKAAAAAAITVTLASLAAGSMRQSTFVDNTASGTTFLDALVRVKTLGSSGSTSTLDVYVYASAESTSQVYTDGASGSDSAFSGVILNSVLLGQVVMNGAVSVTAGPWGIAEKFGGNLPPNWGLIFVNNSGGNLDATAGNHSVVYQGTYEVVA